MTHEKHAYLWRCRRLRRPVPIRLSPSTCSSSPAIDLSFSWSTMSSLDPLSTTVSSLKREQLIPDVLPESFTPSLLFSVVWPSGSEAILGNVLAKEDLVDEPALSFTPFNVSAVDADSDGSQEATYTLAFFDPDAPSRADAKYKSFRHWVVRSDLLLFQCL